LRTNVNDEPGLASTVGPGRKFIPSTRLRPGRFGFTRTGPEEDFDQAGEFRTICIL